MAKVKALVITGYGLNCEAETSHVLEQAGAEVTQIHLSDLIAGEVNLKDFQLLALIGGFSFGDHISGGIVFANRLKNRLNQQIKGFIAENKLVIGICNGFQTLVKLGLLPGNDNDYETQRVTIMPNESGAFRDAWVQVKVNKDSNCVFTRGVDYLDLPVRHGEGNFYIQDMDLFDDMKKQGQIVLQYCDPDTKEPTSEYPHNPNGAIEAIAGICDPRGRIFGLMPHPEAFWSPYNHPHWIQQKMEDRLPKEGQGMGIFHNAVSWLKENA